MGPDHRKQAQLVVRVLQSLVDGWERRPPVLRNATMQELVHQTRPLVWPGLTHWHMRLRRVATLTPQDKQAVQDFINDLQEELWAG